MPAQIVYEIRCPACTAIAELWVAEPYTADLAVKVLAFYCPRDNGHGHPVLQDRTLLRRLPAVPLTRIEDHP